MRRFKKVCTGEGGEGGGQEGGRNQIKRMGKYVCAEIGFSPT